MIYTCDKCDKVFNQKSHYEAHLRRKFPCLKIYDQLLDETNKNNLTQNLTHKNAQKRTNTQILTHKNAQKQTTELANNYVNSQSEDLVLNILCEHCKLSFSRKDTLTRHIKKYCKGEKSEISVIEKIDDLTEKVNLLTEQNNNLNKQLYLSAKKKNTSKTSNPPTISNISNILNTNNGQIINNNISIKMVSFGDEDFNRLTEGEILNVLKSKNKAFLNLVKLIHLNERLPEYNNILINNLKSNYGSIFDETKMIVQNKKQIIGDLITNRLYDLQQLVIKYKQTKFLSKKEIEILGSVIGFLKNSNLDDEDIDGNIIRPDKETTKKIKELYDELILMFYNDRDLVEQTLKQLTAELEQDDYLYLDV